MTIEQRIIDIAEKQNYYDSSELRAIALEVRKREDRIKQLEDYGNALVAHVYAYRTQRQWTEESYHDLIQTIADWDKAKATKL